jgi:hypothetical protein
MSLPYHPEANEELEQAIRDYAKVDPELADSLIDAVLRAEDEIVEEPLRYPVAEDAPVGFEVRYRLLKKFKFRLVYVVDEGQVQVVAFAHLRKRPAYWHNRI